jgi:hypothetical protein
MVAALAGIVVLAGLGVALAVTSPASSDPAAMAAVQTAAQATAAAQTVTFSLSGQVSASSKGQNQTIAFSANGQADAANQAAKVTLNVEGAGTGSTTLSAVLVGGTFYESVHPGQWISTPVSSLSQGTAPTTAVNPQTWLHLLEAHGVTATDLGTSTVDGQAVHGYRLTISPSALAQGLQGTSLPAAEQQVIVRDLQDASLGLDVYVAQSGGQLVQAVFDGSISAQGTTVTAHLTLDLSGYGAPVSITAPPASEVTPAGQATLPSGL